MLGVTQTAQKKKKKAPRPEFMDLEYMEQAVKQRTV